MVPRLVLIVALVAAAIVYLAPPRVNLPPHLVNHTVYAIPDFLAEQVGEDLRALIATMKVFPSNANDAQFYKVRHEHIGEAIPFGPNGCEHPYLVPNANRTLCILPGRIDIARHYITTGGFEGLKEPYEKLISRVQSFGRYMFDLREYPVVEKLFASSSFQEAAVKVCPPNKRFVDPFQFNFIIQVPGQTVAMHVDAVYFWGATRFDFPQWLLAVMQFSGLFKEEFVDQIQVVGYLHKWKEAQANDELDGAFVYWNENGKEAYIPSRPLLGNIVDGSKVVHAAVVYKRDQTPPFLDKSAKNELVYLGGSAWQLQTNGKPYKNYTFDDLRISIVYRARCFVDQEEADKFKNLPESERMSLSYVLEKLKSELVRRGMITQAKIDAMSPLDLGLFLVDSYVTYPLPPTDRAWLPFNYCALGKAFPALQSLTDLICPSD